MIVKYGYVRVSTKDQNENRQLEAMKQLEILKKNITRNNKNTDQILIGVSLRYF